MLSSDGLSSYSVLCCKHWDAKSRAGHWVNAKYDWIWAVRADSAWKSRGNQCAALLKRMDGWKTLIVLQQFSGRDPVSLLPSPWHRRFMKMSKQTWRCFSSRGGEPGNFIYSVFLCHKIALSSASSCVFLIWVGDALIVPRGHFRQSEMSTSIRAHAVVTHIQHEQVHLAHLHIFLFPRVPA